MLIDSLSATDSAIFTVNSSRYYCANAECEYLFLTGFARPTSAGFSFGEGKTNGLRNVAISVFFLKENPQIFLNFRGF